MTRSVAAAAVIVLAGQTPSPPPLTLLSRDGRRTIQLSLVGGQEFVALDDLASVFQLAVHDESLGAITVSYKGRTIVLTPDQALASIAGRLVSLPAPPTRLGRWLVPVEFISRALTLIYDTRLDLRKPSHLLVIGDLRVPRVTVRYEPLGTGSTGARLTIDATPRAPASVLQENDRLAIKFDADALDLAPPQIPASAAAIVQGVRQVDAVSLSVDLGPRFAAFRASTAPAGLAVDGPSRLVIDFIATQAEAPAPPPQPPPPPLPPPPDLSTLAGAPGIHTIAIDPGHGGDDQGVVGTAGAKEKDLTLTVARRLKAAVEARLGIRVLLTRDDDRSVGLDDRAAAANNNKADLLISLHASFSLRPGTSGASIFYAAFDADDAARTSQVERVPTFAGVMRDIELVPWALAQTRHVEKSASLAQVLEQQLRGRVPLLPRAVGRAPLRVLESANMPAVIVELGYLSNAEQERRLTSSEFQNTFVQAVVDAIVKFRDAYVELP